MSDERWDVVVIGGGPAGSVAARQVRRLAPELRVLLVDRATFPRDKVCGGCLNASAVRSLAGAGLGEVIGSLRGEPLEAVRVFGGGRAVTLPLPGGVAVSRRVLDVALLDAARREGVEVREGVAARVAARVAADEGQTFRSHNVAQRRRDSERILTLRDSATGETRAVRAKVVIVADGLRGGALDGIEDFDMRERRGSRIGLGAVLRVETPMERGVIHMMIGDGGYVGAVRVEAGLVDIAAAANPEYVRDAGGAGEALGKIIQGSRVAEVWVETVTAAARGARWAGTPRLTRCRDVAGEGIFVVGDAAGYVEPYTGEGMAWAIRGGLEAAPLAVEAGRSGDLQALANRWRWLHGREVRRKQAGCRAVASTLRHPTLRRAAMASLRGLTAFPGGRRVVAAAVRGLFADH